MSASLIQTYNAGDEIRPGGAGYKMKPLVSVGGYGIPDPSTYSSTTATIVDSARNVKGYMVGAVIRQSVAKVECTWKYIKAQEWADIMSIFNASFINNVHFYNQDTNAWETRQMYVSDRTANIFLRRPDGSIRGFLDTRLALIEV